MGIYRCFVATIFYAFLALVLGGYSPAFSQVAGERDYNPVTNSLGFYDGEDWYNFASGLPTGFCSKEGEMEFNNLLSKYQYCDGSNWRVITGVPTLMLCSKKGAIDFINDTYMYCNGLLWMDMRGLAGFVQALVD